MPPIHIERNGFLQEVTKAQLFALAQNGQINPETPLHYQGKVTVVGKVKGIVFSQEPTGGVVDEFDHTQTMRPDRKAAERNNLDAETTMRPMPPSLPRDDLDAEATMRPPSLPRDGVKNDDLKRGDVLDGKFHVIKKLGQGGMGVVYKVVDNTTDVEYAVKVVLPEYIEDPMVLKELRAELAKAQSFTHQNLLNYRFFADSGPIKYIVMELIDGEDLEEYRLRKGGKFRKPMPSRLSIIS